jgi:EmrB/QacA subfamily drug resistance transporter
VLAVPDHDDRPHPLRSLAILCVAGLAFSLAQTTVIPALGDLKERLGTDETGAAWTLTGYLLSAAVATPVAGRLGDMFGKRRLLVLSLLAFGAGSVVSAVGSSLGVVVAGRVLQGVGGGIFPLCFGIIRDEFPRERVAGSIGLISAILGIGGGLGLVLGGLLVDQTSYHMIFWLGAGMAVIAAAAAQLLIPESPVRTPGRVDWRGAAVLSVGLALPLLAISQANTWGWGDARTLGLIAVGLVVLALWVPLERRTPAPLADIEVLSTPPVLMTNVATLFVGFGMFGAFLLIPQLAESPEATGYGFGLDATGAGLLMLPGALVMLVAGPLSGRLSGMYGSRVPLALGAAITAAGLLFLGLEHSTHTAVLLGNVVMSIGFGFAFAAMPNLIVDAVPVHQTGEATGFNALVRAVGSSVGSQVSAAVLAGSAVAAGSPPTDDGFTAAFVICAAVALLAAVTAAFIPRPAVAARTARDVGVAGGGAGRGRGAGAVGEPAVLRRDA